MREEERQRRNREEEDTLSGPGLRMRRDAHACSCCQLHMGCNNKIIKQLQKNTESGKNPGKAGKGREFPLL